MRLKIVCCLLALLIVASGAAYADTFGGITVTVTTGTQSGGTFNGDTFFTATLSGNSCTLFANCNWLGEVAFDVLNTKSGALVGTTQPSGWIDGIYGTVGGNSGAGDCQSNNSNFVCWATTATNGGGTLSGPYSYSFTAYFNPALVNGTINPYHIQATFYNGSVSSTNKVGQISNDINCPNGGTCVVTPEPASIMLLGVGLLALGGLVRRKHK